jgi:hypothetical protein
VTVCFVFARLVLFVAASRGPGTDEKLFGFTQVQAKTQLGKVDVVCQNVWVQLAIIVHLPQRLV